MPVINPVPARHKLVRELLDVFDIKIPTEKIVIEVSAQNDPIVKVYVKAFVECDNMQKANGVFREMRILGREWTETVYVDDVEVSDRCEVVVKPK